MNLALYREFRPKNFDEIVGQDYIVKTLKNQIKTDRLIDEYQVKTADGRELNIKEYEIAKTKTRRYMTNFEYKDAQYQIMGDIEKDEFEKIVKNLIFL